MTRTTYNINAVRMTSIWSGLKVLIGQAPVNDAKTKWRHTYGRASWTGHAKRVEVLHFSKSLCNKLTVTMQPHILYLQILCCFKAETYRYLLCESHEFRFKDVGDMSICFWRFKGGGGGRSCGGGSGLYKVLWRALHHFSQTWIIFMLLHQTLTILVLF